jgi:hypothetical protein
MAVSIERMGYVARFFANLFDDPGVEPIAALELVRQHYREDANFISPNPPHISSEFGTTLNGRDEIMKYHEVCMEIFPAGCANTIDIISGLNMAIWVYEAKLTKMVAADVLLFDEEGMIEFQRVTSGGVNPEYP